MYIFIMLELPSAWTGLLTMPSGLGLAARQALTFHQKRPGLYQLLRGSSLQGKWNGLQARPFQLQSARDMCLQRRCSLPCLSAQWQTQASGISLILYGQL